MGWTLRARTTQIEEAGSLITPSIHVTAVVVAHNGAAYLPRVLHNLAEQSRAPDRCIGVDAGSWDGSAAQLEAAFSPQGVLRIENRRSFGAALKQGLAHLAPAGDNPRGEYLWLLHDDSAPDTTALAELLLAVETAPSVTVAGCKNVAWGHASTLVDVGLEASRSGERLTMIERDEHDQGQYDTRSDMLAVNSAGMLIRRDVWDQLGGFDPALPAVGDDIDFCWRNWLAGHRTIVVPAARVHYFVSRPHGLASAKATKTAQVYTRLKHASGWQLPLLWIGAFLGGLGHLLLSLLCKIPGAGWQQLFATTKALGRVGALVRGRRCARRTRTLSRSVTRPLLVPARDVRTHQRAVGEALLGEQQRESPQTTASPHIPDGDAADDFTALDAPPSGKVAGAGVMVAVLVLALVAFGGLFRLLGASALEGGALRPAADSLATLWRHATSWWMEAGAGTPGAAPPFSSILLVLGLSGLGDASLAIVWLFFLSLPLAGVGAWSCGGIFGVRSWLRVLAALLWGTSPVLLVGLDNGRLPALIVHLLLPWIVFGVMRTLEAGGNRGGSYKPVASSQQPDARSPWMALAATSLLVAVVLACAPTLAPLLLLTVVSLLITGCGRRKPLWWLFVPALVLWAPYLLTHAGEVRALFGDPGVLTPSLSAPSWQQLLGFPQTLTAEGGTSLSWLPSGPPWGYLAAVVIGGPTLVLALAALLWPHGRSGQVRFLWLVALGALITAYASTWIVTGVSGSHPVKPYSGPAVSVAALALLIAAMVGLGRLMDGRVSGAAGNLRGVLAGTGALLLLIAPVVSAVTWIAGNFTAPPALARVEKGLIPATASDRGQSQERSRTLVLTAPQADGGALNAQLMRGEGNTLDTLSPAVYAQGLTGPLAAPERAEDDPATASLRTASAMIMASTGADPRPILTSLGVGFVVLRAGGPGVQTLAERLDSVPGLTPVGLTDGGWLWRVDFQLAGAQSSDAHGAARILDSQGGTVSYLPMESPTQIGTQLAPGPAGRSLVLAERSDANWSAWLDGRKLDVAPGPPGAPWAQSFALPAEGGTLDVRYEQPWAPWVLAVQLGVFMLTLLMSVPLPAAHTYVARTRARGFCQKEFAS